MANSKLSTDKVSPAQQRERMARRIEAAAALAAWNDLREQFWRSRGRWVEARRADLAARLASSALGVLERIARGCGA